MKKILIIISITIFIIALITITKFNPNHNFLEATILSYDNNQLEVKDKNNNTYTFNIENLNVYYGDQILIEYTGSKENPKIITTKILNVQTPLIFNKYYHLALQKLSTLTIEEKIGQLFLVRYPDNSKLTDSLSYNFGGYVFYAKDFQNKNKEQVISMIDNLNNNSSIPLLTAVDEEGGTVVRISSNPLLSKTPFKSSQELYKNGGFNLIKEDTITKSKLLSSLKINLNLAPIIDVCPSPNDYMYKRSLGQNTTLTSEYAKTVIESSQNTGVSYTLKHFPGYGNNIDTHNSSSKDTRTLESIKENDLPPFIEGIKANAEAILVSHNIITNVDKDNPASLSKEIHNILTEDLKFTGIIITDDLDMGATKNIDDASLKAIIANNDLLIVTDYQKHYNTIYNAYKNNTLTEEEINNHVLKILAWKYYKNLLN